MKHYNHLSHQERAILIHRLEMGLSLKNISISLSRSPSTVSRELQRNHSYDTNYQFVIADKAYHRRRLNSRKAQKLTSKSDLSDIVNKYLVSTEQT